MSEELLQLRKIIVESIDSILLTCTKRQEDFPLLNAPAHSSEFSTTGIRNDPAIIDASALAISAASQLIATLQPPATTVANAAGSFSLSACIATVERLNVPEILRSAGPNGMHVDDIVKRNGADARKISRILRYLATHHIFRELSPDYYKHNMISSVLDTGKDVSAIQRDPVTKYDHTNGVAAFVSLLSEEGIKAGSFLPETMADPEASRSQDPAEASFQRAYGFEGTRWDYLDRPENLLAFKRYGAAVVGTSKIQMPSALFAYDWANFPKNGVVIDVGCGVGNISLEISKLRHDLMFVLQDRPTAIEYAKAYWKREAPLIHASGGLNVRFIEHDIFEPQPKLPRPADAVILRHVLHNWSDNYAKEILVNLRQTAKADTKLMIVESIIEHTCPTPTLTAGDVVPGYHPETQPRPLLANLGPANALAYSLDIAALSTCNGQERTITQFRDLLENAGWDIIQVVKPAANRIAAPLLIAIPAPLKVRRFTSYP